MRNDHGPRADAHIQAHFVAALAKATEGEDEDEDDGEYRGPDSGDFPEADEL
jgi:hypothetical protein